jgi:hypothetical protein
LNGDLLELTKRSDLSIQLGGVFRRQHVFNASVDKCAAFEIRRGRVGLGVRVGGYRLG